MKINILAKGITVAAIAAVAPLTAQAQEDLRFAHVYETSHPLHQGALMAAEDFAERTDGRYNIEVFPASSLGSESALNEAISLGTVDIIYTGAGFAGSIYGPISMTDYPFMFRGFAHWQAYSESDLFHELAAGFADATGGNTIAAISYYGTRHVTANRPILAPADMEDVKIRVPDAPSYVMFPQAVGANPTPIAFAEVYLALQQGVVDAQENPLPTIQAKRFYEVQSDINLTGHITNSTFTAVSAIRLAGMSDEDRAILFEVLQESAEWITDEIVRAEEELVAWFRDEGVTVNEVDRGPFIEAVQPALLGDGLPYSSDLYERLQALPDAN